MASEHLTMSVVVPSYHRLDLLPALVQEYVDQGADQVVVVLDGPHPGWQQSLAPVLAAAGDTDVVIEELPANRGLARARVAGLALCTSEAVLIADDDVAPGPGLLDRHRAFHVEHPNSALLGYMPVALPHRRGPDQAATFIYARDYENQASEWRAAGESTSASPVLLRSFWGGNASIGRELYRRAEAFMPSERLDYNEDLDLGLRLLAIGATAAFDEKAASVHHHRRGYTAFLRECEVRGRAVVDLEARWPSLPDQLTELVRIPASHSRLESALQRRIGSRNTPGFLEWMLGVSYRATGSLKLWKMQDALARFVRRGLAMRGYRMARPRTELAG